MAAASLEAWLERVVVEPQGEESRTAARATLVPFIERFGDVPPQLLPDVLPAEGDDRLRAAVRVLEQAQTLATVVRRSLKRTEARFLTAAHIQKLGLTEAFFPELVQVFTRALNDPEISQRACRSLEDSSLIRALEQPLVALFHARGVVKEGYEFGKFRRTLERPAEYVLPLLNRAGLVPKYETAVADLLIQNHDALPEGTRSYLLRDVFDALVDNNLLQTNNAYAGTVAKFAADSDVTVPRDALKALHKAGRTKEYEDLFWKVIKESQYHAADALLMLGEAGLGDNRPDILAERFGYKAELQGLESFSRVARESESTELIRQLQNLARESLRSDRYHLRAGIIELISQNGWREEFRKELNSALQDGSPSVRVAAVRAHINLRVLLMPEEIRTLLSDPSGKVQIATAQYVASREIPVEFAHELGQLLDGTPEVANAVAEIMDATGLAPMFSQKLEALKASGTISEVPEHVPTWTNYLQKILDVGSLDDQLDVLYAFNARDELPSFVDDEFASSVANMLSGHIDLRSERFQLLCQAVSFLGKFGFSEPYMQDIDRVVITALSDPSIASGMYILPALDAANLSARYEDYLARVPLTSSDSEAALALLGQAGLLTEHPEPGRGVLHMKPEQRDNPRSTEYAEWNRAQKQAKVITTLVSSGSATEFQSDIAWLVRNSASGARATGALALLTLLQKGELRSDLPMPRLDRRATRITGR